MEDKRLIKVTGKGNLKVKPDVTRITITLEGCYKVYEESLRRSSEDTESLKDVLEGLGFKREDVKTLSFNVNTKRESYQTKTGNWKERFVGYEFRHVMKVEFDSDNARLGKVLYALANAEKITPEFWLSYTVKDKEASKNELLGKAVEDAKAKAVVLSKAAGVKLKQIQSIDYSWGEINFECSPISEHFRNQPMMMCKESGSYDMNIEPDDIEVSDTVTVMWEIG